jgi:N-acetyltransferase
VTVPPDGRTLANHVVRLDRLADADYEELYDAIADPRVYEYGFGGGLAALPGSAGLMRHTWSGLLAKRIAYVVRLAADGELGPAGTIVGTSSLGDVDVVNEEVHLGWTGYAPRTWGSAVNPATKLLLLGHAFEDCGFGRVRIQTDLRNERSQAAIAKLGATREGVLRRHLRRADGTFRDTVLFSIIADEWPDVRSRLEARLNLMPFIGRKP